MKRFLGNYVLGTGENIKYRFPQTAPIDAAKKSLHQGLTKSPVNKGNKKKVAGGDRPRTTSDDEIRWGDNQDQERREQKISQELSVCTWIMLSSSLFIPFSSLILFKSPMILARNSQSNELGRYLLNRPNKCMRFIIIKWHVSNPLLRLRKGNPVLRAHGWDRPRDLWK